MLERCHRVVDALTGDIESRCNLRGAPRFVEKPAHPERGGREEFNPVNVIELRTEVSICFNDWVISYPHATLVVGATDFGEESSSEQLVKYIVEMCPRVTGFCREFGYRRLTAGTKCIYHSESGLREHLRKL
jgi:hypothetical protein